MFSGFALAKTHGHDQLILLFGLRGPGAARLPRLATRHHRRGRRLCASRAEMGAQLGSSVAFGSGCGQALPGVPRKALYAF